MEIFSSVSADGVWRKAHAAVLPGSGLSIHQSSPRGDTREILHAVLQIGDPRRRWVFSRRPAINPAFAIAEVVWILAGEDEAAALNYWFPRLPEFSGKGPVYEGAYGFRLRRNFGFDQLMRACDVLRSRNDCRQVVLQIWDAARDMPAADGSPRSLDVPCNVMSLLKVRDGRLEWTQIMRSNDLYRGLPYNFIQFTVLHEILAGWIGCSLGTYHLWCDSLHVYDSDLATFFCETSEPDDAPLPDADSLAVDFASGEKLTGEMYARMVELSRPGLRPKDIEELSNLTHAPVSYQGLLFVLCAEAARRRGFRDLASTIMARCDNRFLSKAWTAWEGRVSGGAAKEPER